MEQDYYEFRIDDINVFDRQVDDEDDENDDDDNNNNNNHDTTNNFHQKKNIKKPIEFFIQLFGLNEMGEKYSVMVENFKPFFYVKVPENWDNQMKNQFVNHIHTKLGYFDNSYPTASDFDFWLRCLSQDVRFDKIYEIVGSYYYNPNGLSTNNQSSNLKESEIIKEKYKYVK